MTRVKRSPNEPVIEVDDSWSDDETIVDRHNRLDYRIRRIVRQWWLWTLIVVILVASLFDAAIMTALISLAGLAVQFLFLASFIIFQFVVFFWFGARTRMYEVMPGAEGIGFKDYRGQP